MTTLPSALRQPDARPRLYRLRWLGQATSWLGRATIWLGQATIRPRAGLRHIRITGQLGHFDDPDDARRTGARF